jgi:conjugative relaxase-like TrwC/TraI family protein
MITVTKIKAGNVKAMADYLCPDEEVEMAEKELGAKAGYYFKSKELASRDGFWAGSLAAEWGLAYTKVTHEQFVTLAKGFHPETGKRLVAPARGKHVMAYDMTVSLPKGISLAWAAADAEGKRAIEADFRASIEDAIAHVEEQGKVVRRKINGQTVSERSDGLAIGAFEHFTSRETAEVEVPDAQLHWHLIVFSVGKRQADKLGKGKQYREHGAIEMRTLTTMKIELDSIVQTNLQQRFEARGLQTLTMRELDEQKLGRERSRDSNREFFIKGFTDRALTLKWSKRSQQVQGNVRTILKEKGYDPDGPVPRKVKDEAIQLAKVMGRREKRSTPADLLERWQAALAEDGITLETFKNAFGKKVRREPTKEKVLEAAIGRLHERGAVVPWWELRTLVAEEAIYRGLSGDQTKALLDSIYTAEDNGQELHEDLVAFSGRVTSRDWARQEQEVVDAVKELASCELPSLTSEVDLHDVAVDVLAKLNEERLAEGKDPISLGKDQKKALEKMWSKRVNLAVGQAGAGKTLVAQVLVEGHRRGAEVKGGKSQIIGVSVAKEKTIQFGRDVRADKVMSFEALDLALAGRGGERLNTNNRTLVVIDEACMADTARLRSLLRLNRQVSLLALGDPKQMPSIGSGGKALWGHLEAVAGESAVIDEIHRTQRDDLRGREVDGVRQRGVWELMRADTTVDQAIEHYRKEGALRFFSTDEEAEEAVMDEWEQRWENKPSKVKAIAVICDRSNIEIDRLNDEAAARLRATGQLKGDGAKTVWVDPENRNYQREQTLFAGSYVGVTRNLTVHSGHYKIDLQNGERAFVKSVERDENGMAAKVVLSVLRESAPEVTISKPEQIALLRQSWVTHTYREQGSTFQHDLVLQGRGTTNASAYVAITRAQETALVFTSDEALGLDDAEGEPLEQERTAALAAQWRKTEEQESAISFVEAADAARAKDEAERNQEVESELAVDEVELDEQRELEEQLVREEEDRRHREELDEGRRVEAA